MATLQFCVFCRKKWVKRETEIITLNCPAIGLPSYSPGHCFLVLMKPQEIHETAQRTLTNLADCDGRMEFMDYLKTSHFWLPAADKINASWHWPQESS